MGAVEGRGKVSFIFSCGSDVLTFPKLLQMQKVLFQHTRSQEVKSCGYFISKLAPGTRSKSQILPVFAYLQNECHNSLIERDALTTGGSLSLAVCDAEDSAVGGDGRGGEKTGQRKPEDKDMNNVLWLEKTLLSCDLDTGMVASLVIFFQSIVIFHRYINKLPQI